MSQLRFTQAVTVHAIVPRTNDRYRRKSGLNHPNNVAHSLFNYNEKTFCAAVKRIWIDKEKQKQTCGRVGVREKKRRNYKQMGFDFLDSCSCDRG